MVSKTTYRLRSYSDAASLDNEDEEELELMEIPLSPTHYEQPPTPDHDPPTPFQAECEIQKVLDSLRMVREKAGVAK